MSSEHYPSHQNCRLFYPVAAYEITLLARAQQVVKRKEEAHFLQLDHTFNWDISRLQKAAYLESMQLGYTLILTDVSNTIVWTSRNFLSLTGYRPQEVIGKTPKMFQGPETDPLVTRHIGHSIRQVQAVQADLVNYRKSGQTYICQLDISPLRNTQGALTHFIAKAIAGV